jgi:hypothetical protein
LKDDDDSKEENYSEMIYDDEKVLKGKMEEI